MKKLITRIVLGVVILIVVAVALVWIMINPIAETAVEKGAGAALGVETKLDNISISLLGGSVQMKGLNIANPEGFASPYLMDMKQFDIAVGLGSLMSETVEITNFVLDGLELNIEKKGSGSNIDVIVENTKGSKEKEGEGKKIHADKIVIRNVVAHFYLSGYSEGGGITVPVREIVLTDFTSDQAGSVAGELTGQLFPALLASVIQNAKGIVPADLLKDLDKSVMALAENVGSEAMKQMESLSEEMKKQLKDLKIEESIKDIKINESIQDAGKSVEEGLGGLTEGLFGKKKNPEEESNE